MAALSCAKKPPPAEAPPRPLHLAVDGPISTLDPTYTEHTTFSVLSNLYEPLVDYDRNLRLVPALASEWSTPDDKTWLLKLRDGVRFHDGTALTGEDAAAALLRAKDDPISGLRGRLETIAAVDVPRPGELRIRTARPDALLLHALVGVLIGKGKTRAEIDAHPVGTGPYRLVRWDLRTLTEIEAFPQYWRGPARIARALFVPVPTGDSRVLALKEGRLDVGVVPAEVVPDRKRGFRIADSPGLTTYYLFLSTQPAAGRDNPLRQKPVRQALALAIDRRAVSRKAAGHEGAAAFQMVPPSIFGYAADLPPPPFDAAAARQLLERAHLAPVRLELVHRDGADALAVAQTVKSMLDAAGFQIRLRVLPWPELLAASSSQSLPLYLSRWAFDNGDAGSFLRDCLRSRHPPSPDGTYNAGYSNPEMDRLIDESASAFDDHVRLATFARIARLAQEDVPLVPLFNQPDIWGVAAGVEWQPRLDARLLVYEMSRRDGPG